MATVRRLAVCTVAIAPLIVSTAIAAGLVKVTSGRWDGRAWTFAASDEVSGVNVNYCWRLAFSAGPDGGGGCSTYINKANSPLLPFDGMDVAQSLAPCPGIDYVDGPVASSASTVAITLSNGGVVRTKTIAPPAGLARSVRFFVARIPCGTLPATASGRTSSGKVVARYT